MKTVWQFCLSFSTVVCKVPKPIVLKIHNGYLHPINQMGFNHYVHVRKGRGLAWKLIYFPVFLLNGAEIDKRKEGYMVTTQFTHDPAEWFECTRGLKVVILLISKNSFGCPQA